MTTTIANGENKRKMKFEAFGRACVTVFGTDNVWQAVEQCRLTMRKEILRREHAGQNCERERADYAEMCEIADYFADQLATRELNGGVS